MYTLHNSRIKIYHLLRIMQSNLCVCSVCFMCVCVLLNFHDPFNSDLYIPTDTICVCCFPVHPESSNYLCIHINISTLTPLFCFYSFFFSVRFYLTKTPQPDRMRAAKIFSCTKTRQMNSQLIFCVFVLHTTAYILHTYLCFYF